MEVSFNEEPSVGYTPAPGKQGMAGWMVRNKFAKDEKNANYILVGIAVAAVILSFFLLFSSRGDTTLNADERMRLEQSTPIIQP
ncbi:MAG: hypothetical protein V4682_03515 [Patescibacteria group bacterium]